LDFLDIERIFSYIGVDNIKFGMSPEEVASIWGAADRIRTNFFNEPVEFRNGISTTYSHEKKLVEIGIPKECTNVKLNDIPIFLPPKKDRLAQLLMLDSSAWEDVGMIAFKNLGISITGFEDPDDSDVAMSVFSRGRWDADFETMAQYRPKI